MRRNNRMPTNKTTRRDGYIPRSGIVNESKGSQAPIYMKQPQLKTRSMTDEKASPSICTLKSPSHDIAVPMHKKGKIHYIRLLDCKIPAAKAARRSSLPIILMSPAVNMAKAKYWAI